MRRASWSVHRSSPTIRYGNKIHIKQKMEKMKEQKSIFASLPQHLAEISGGVWQLNKNGHIGGLCPRRKFYFISFYRVLRGNGCWRGDEDRREKLKDEWKKERKKKGFSHSTSAVFPWKQFSQRCHRQECLWCRVRIFDKVAATQKKPEGDTERKKEKGKKRGCTGR